MEDWLVLRKKPAVLLTNLRNSSQSWYISSLARAAGITYVYAAHMLSSFEKAGLVSFEAKGRVKVVRLTEKGGRLAAALDEAVRILGEGGAKPVEEKAATERAEKPEKEKAEKNEKEKA